MTKPILVAVAWPYANGDLHLGRVAGALLPADIFARYHRLLGNDVLMISGSDAHGTPITLAADKQGISPRQLFTQYHHRFLKTQQALGISFDLFTHTDTENHHQVAQEIFCHLYEAGYIHPRQQRLLYSESQGRFLPDRYIEGRCPICGYEQARGDQCDECGHILEATELLNPRSVIDNTTPVVRETEHLFLDLPAFSDRLEAFLATAVHWRPHPRHFSQSYIAQGLKARPITRDLTWGIPVPLAGWEEKKLYIWFENIIGYLSAAKEWATHQGQPEAWQTWWLNPNAQSYYFLGKDNIPFHTIFWPAELLGLREATGQAYNLPYDVPANAFLTLEGQQFSTSRNWAVWLPDMLNRYKPDTLRYYLTANLPELADANFSWSAFVQRNNSELVAAWGNLIHRVTSFAFKHWQGVVPEPGPLRPFDHALLAQIENGFATVGHLLDHVRLRPALNETVALARVVNRYLEQAPWFQVIHTDKTTAATTVYTALRAIDSLKILFAPFLPFTTEALHQILGYERPLFGQQQIVTYKESTRTHDALVYDATQANGRWQPSQLTPGQKLAKPKPLYPKLDDHIITEERARLGLEPL